MKKIHKVIDNCNECEHCKFLEYTRNNYTFFNVCDKEENEPFLLLKHQSKSNNVFIDIPEKCPLQTYTEPENEKKAT